MRRPPGQSWNGPAPIWASGRQELPASGCRLNLDNISSDELPLVSDIGLAMTPDATGLPLRSFCNAEIPSKNRKSQCILLRSGIWKTQRNRRAITSFAAWARRVRILHLRCGFSALAEASDLSQVNVSGCATPLLTPAAVLGGRVSTTVCRLRRVIITM